VAHSLDAAVEDDKTTTLPDLYRKSVKTTESASSPTRLSSKRGPSILISSYSNNTTRILCSNKVKINKNPLLVSTDVSRCRRLETKGGTGVDEFPKIIFPNNE